MGWLKKNGAGDHDGKNTAKGTVIGPGLVLEGKLESDEDVWIAGRIKGEVHCKRKVIVAKGGHIEASVHCSSIVIFGEVVGNVVAKEHVIIESSGRLIGDICTKLLTNQPGGFFEGYSKMMDEETQAAGKVESFSEKAKEQKKPTEEKQENKPSA
jgi:cytoskeletal protein CcmA (bactofilin family)